MYAITGITGQVGGAVARNLLSAKCPVRAVLRDVGKAAPWAARGCDIALAAIDDAAALTAAFQGAEGESSSCCHRASTRRRAFPRCGGS